MWSAITETGDAMLNPVISIWNSFIKILPGLIGALIVLILGYLIAALIGWIIRKFFLYIKLDKQIAHAKLADSIGHISLTRIGELMVRWYIFIIFLTAAVDLTSMGTITVLLSRLVLWLPNLLVAIIILLAGLMFAGYVCDRINESNVKGIRIASIALRVMIIWLAVVIALKQIGIEVGLAENLFLIIMGAIALAIALAVGISFGLELKDEARDIIKHIKRRV